MTQLTKQNNQRRERPVIIGQIGMGGTSSQSDCAGPFVSCNEYGGATWPYAPGGGYWEGGTPADCCSHVFSYLDIFEGYSSNIIADGEDYTTEQCGTMGVYMVYNCYLDCDEFDCGPLDECNCSTDDDCYGCEHVLIDGDWNIKYGGTCTDGCQCGDYTYIPCQNSGTSGILECVCGNGNGAPGGCTNPEASNYDPNAYWNNGTCQQYSSGNCTNPYADNWVGLTLSSDDIYQYGMSGLPCNGDNSCCEITCDEHHTLLPWWDSYGIFLPGNNTTTFLTHQTRCYNNRDLDVIQEFINLNPQSDIFDVTTWVPEYDYSDSGILYVTNAWELENIFSWNMDGFGDLSVGKNKRIRQIALHNHNLSQLPNNLPNLQELGSLYLYSNNLTSLPVNICDNALTNDNITIDVRWNQLFEDYYYWCITYWDPQNPHFEPGAGGPDGYISPPIAPVTGRGERTIPERNLPTKEKQQLINKILHSVEVQSNNPKKYKEITLRGTTREITQQLLNLPGARQVLSELGMTPQDLGNNIYGVVEAIDKGEHYRFPSCNPAQSYCQGSGLCTGPACFRDCSHFGGGFLQDHGMGFNIGGGGSMDWGTYEYNFGVYQGAGGSMTWECNIGIGF